MRPRSARRRLAVLGAGAAIVVGVLVAALAARDGDDAGVGPGSATSTTAASEPEGDPDGVFTVGALIPSTGDLDFVGEGMAQAAEMVVRDLNEAGGVLGRDVALIVEDTASRPALARATVEEWLASGDVDLVVGPMSSQETRAVAPDVTRGGVVQCSPTATGLDLVGYGTTGNFFSTAPPDTLQAHALADLVAGDDVGAVSLLHVDDAYGEPFAEAAARRLAERGVEVDEVVALDAEASTYEAEAATAAGAGSDAFVVVAFPETTAAVIRALDDAGAGPRQMPIYLTDSSQTSGLGSLVDPDDPGVVAGIRGTAPSAAPSTGAAAFAEAFERDAPDVRPVFAAHLYDCIALGALAVEAAGSDDPGRFREYIGDVSREGAACVAVERCLALLGEGEDIDYQGASGPVDVGDDATVDAGEYELWSFSEQVDDGRVLIAIDGTRTVAADGTVGPAPEAAA